MERQQQPLLRDNEGKDDTWVDVHYTKIAGFSSESIRVYVREEAHEMWVKMETLITSSSLSVSGPPGTGKSTEAWAWALWKAQQSKVDIIWYHMTKEAIIKVIVSGTTNTMVRYTIDCAFINVDINEAGGQYMIFDGITKDMYTSVHSSMNVWRNNVDNREFISVSSQAVKVALQEMQEARMQIFKMPSWSFIQLDKACVDDILFTMVRNNLKCPGQSDALDDTGDSKAELLRGKFFYAGGSTRWMFGFSFDEFTNDFNTHWLAVCSYETFFNDQGPASYNAVNHLRAMVKNEKDEEAYFFASKFVIQKFLDTSKGAELNFFQLAYTKAETSHNPAFRGWVYEFDVDYQLSKSLANRIPLEVICQVGDKNTKEFWSVPKYVTYANQEELFFHLNQSDEEFWAKPALWKANAIDFFHFTVKEKERHLDATNATHGLTHNVKLHFIYNLCKTFMQKNLPISTIRYVFIVPSIAGFTVGGITGHLNDWRWAQTKQDMISNGNIVIAQLNKAI